MFRSLHNLRPLTGVFLPVFLAIFLFPRTLSAQFDTASVLGTIRDESGAVLAGATVTLTNQATGISATAQTDENGSYEFLTVKIGTYKIEASLASFSTARLENVRVAVGARQRVDLSMKVGEVTTTIEVSASAALLVETDTSDRGQVINQRQIVELPLNGRNYSDLALLTTGVRRSAYAFANPPREGAFNVNGQRSIFNNFMMDGVDNNAYGTSNQGFSNQVVQATPDAVAEFKVVTSQMSAEYGRASGAVINASVKSGTNEFHGTRMGVLAQHFFERHWLLQASHRQTGISAQSVWLYLWRPDRQEPSLLLHRLGRLPRAPEVSRVLQPPDPKRSPGKLSCGRAQPAHWRNLSQPTRPFPRTRSRRLPEKFWRSCRLRTREAVRASNFQHLRADKSNNDKWDVKLDGQINNRMTAFVRASHRKSNIFQAPEIPGPSGGGGNGFIRALNQQLAGAFTFAMDPTSLLEVRVGFSKTIAGKEPPGLGGPSMRSLYGITGLSEDPRLTGGLTNQAVSGFTAFGRQATNPQWQYPYVYNPKVNYSKILGKHSLKTGYEYQRIHTEIQDVNPLYGLGHLQRPVQPPHWRAGRCAHIQRRRLSVWAAQRVFTRQFLHRQLPAGDALCLLAG